MGSRSRPPVHNLTLAGLVVAVGLAGWVVFVDSTPNGDRVDPPAGASGSPAALPPRAHLPARHRIEPEEHVAAAAVASFDDFLASVSARFVDAEGQPLAGVRVVVQIASAGLHVANDTLQPTLRPWHQGRAVSAPDGAFRVSGLAPDERVVLWTEHDPRWVLAEPLLTLSGPFTRTGRDLDLGGIQLHRAASIVGTVRDGEGRPVAGARVLVESVGEREVPADPLYNPDPSAYLITADKQRVNMYVNVVPRMFRPPRQTMTRSADDGSFLVSGLPPGRQAVSVQVGGRRLPVVQTVKCDPGERADLGDVVFAGAPVRGQVVDAEGRPVARATVVVATGAPSDASDTPRHGTPIGVTDAAGRFAIESCPVATLLVAARRTRGQAWTIEPRAVAADEIVLRLAPVFDLTVRALDPAGRPVERPEIRVHAGDDATAAALGLQPLGPGDVPAAERTRWLASGGTRVAGLSKGRYRIHAHADGVGSATRPVDLDGSTELAMTLGQDHRMTVEVVTRAGSPIPRALVHVQGDRTRRPEAGRTDDRGQLVLDSNGAPELRLRVTRPGYAPQVRKVDGAGVARFVMPRVARLEGRIRVDGQEPPFRRWKVRLAGSHQTASVDARGRFFVRSPKLGTDRIASITDEGGRRVPFVVQGIGPDVAFDVREGGTTVLDVTARWKPRAVTGRIRGTVFIDGEPGTGHVVQYADPRSDEPRRAEVDVAGRFDLGEVFYPRVLLRIPSLQTHSIHNDIWHDHVRPSGGETMDLKIDIRTGSLSGRAVASNGQPLADVMVIARAEKGPMRTVDTGEDGRFHFRRVLSGAYDLFVDDGGERATTTGVRVDAGAVVADLLLCTKRTVRVTGRLDLSGLGVERAAPLVKLVGEVEELDRVEAADGSFEIDELLPGTYRVELVFGARRALRLSAREPLRVGDAGVENLVLRFGASYLPSIQRAVAKMGYRDFAHYLAENAK